jgi:hypothetical protein
MEAEQIEQLELSIQEKSIVDISTCTGVRNVHQRLMYQFGGGSGLSLSLGIHGGLKVALCWQRPKEES